MLPQNKTIYLSTNYEVLEILPTCLEQLLRLHSYPVFSTSETFEPYFSANDDCFQKIQHSEIFLALVTPASLIYGYTPDKLRLWDELNFARTMGKQVIFVLAYNLSPSSLKENLSRWGEFPDELEYQLLEIDLEDTATFLRNLQVLTQSLPSQISSKLILHKFVSAEAMIDHALVERYDSELLNRPQKNREIIDACITQYPNYGRAYFERAEEFRWYRDIEIRQKVLVDYSKAIELDPQNARYYAARSHVYFDLDNWSEAIVDISKAITLQPQKAGYYSARASYCPNFPQHQLADSSRAIDLQGDNQLYYEQRSLIYQKLKQYDEALSDLDKAISLARYGTASRFIAAKAFIYLEMGNKEDAKREMERAIKNTKKNSERLDKFIQTIKDRFYEALGE